MCDHDRYQITLTIEYQRSSSRPDRTSIQTVVFLCDACGLHKVFVTKSIPNWLWSEINNLFSDVIGGL